MSGETDNGVVYLLTSPSGKQYVGQTWDYETRMTSYRCGASKDQPALHNAIRKYGWNNFNAVKIAQDIQTQAVLDAKEDAFIVSLNTMSPHGYNLRRGGKGGKMSIESRAKMSVSHRNPSAETRAKLSAAHRGEKNGFYGKKHSLETRNKISMSATGRKHTAETKAKISVITRGRVAWNKGKHHSPETKAKMRRAHLGKKRGPLTEATKEKISAANRGRKHSAAARAKQSAAQRGKKMSPDAVAKTAAWHRGRKRSPEARANMRAAWAVRKAQHRKTTASLL